MYVLEGFHWLEISVFTSRIDFFFNTLCLYKTTVEPQYINLEFQRETIKNSSS